MKGIVTVDIGTTSVRALLFSAAGRVLHAAQRDNAPAAHGDGRVEQDAHTWPAAVLALLAQCAQAAAGQGVAVQAVAVTAQRSSLIAVDAAGTPLHPAIMWQDTRSAALAQAFKPHEALVYRRTGLKISPVFSAIKMLWLRRERPAVWQATRKLLGVQDWVLWNLTGSGRILSQQFGHGYIIGTQGVEVLTGLDGISARGTEPEDFVELRDEGARLDPPSLYDDQLRRRLERGERLWPRGP